MTDRPPDVPHGLPSPDGTFLWNALAARWEPRELWKPRPAEHQANPLDERRLADALHVLDKGIDDGCNVPHYHAAKLVAAEYARLATPPSKLGSGESGA